MSGKVCTCARATARCRGLWEPGCCGGGAAPERATSSTLLLGAVRAGRRRLSTGRAAATFSGIAAGQF